MLTCRKHNYHYKLNRFHDESWKRWIDHHYNNHQNTQYHDNS